MNEIFSWKIDHIHHKSPKFCSVNYGQNWVSWILRTYGWIGFKANWGLEIGIWESTWERFGVRIGSNSKLQNND
jgi:hypothetical protein